MTLDINYIQYIYNTIPLAREYLNDPEFLISVAEKLSHNLVPLPNWEYKNLSFKGDKSNYDQFLDWYYTNYYSSKCSKYDSLPVCYSGALTNEDYEEADNIYESIREKGVNIDYFEDLGNLPVFSRYGSY